MEREGLARKKAKSVTGRDHPTLFGFFSRQRKCSKQDVGLRPTTPEDNSFPNTRSAEDESTPDGESDIVVFITKNFPTVNTEVIDNENENVSKLADFYNVNWESASDEWRNF